jgi:hypothetical protein
MIAPFAPAAGTAVALPAVIKATAAIAAPPVAPPVAAAESPELLALGAELDVKIDAYRAAAGRLAEARVVAARLWPAVPAELVVGFDRADRDLYADCYPRETDFEGKEVWPEPYLINGKSVEYPPRQILRAKSLRQFLTDVREDPDSFEPWLAGHLAECLDAAERFEAARAHAIETSGIAQAKEAAQDRAQDLHSIMFDIRKHVPRTIAGVLILARAVAAFEEAQKDSYSGGQRGGGLVLGRELASAVLRIGGLSSCQR